MADRDGCRGFPVLRILPDIRLKERGGDPTLDENKMSSGNGDAPQASVALVFATGAGKYGTHFLGSQDGNLST